MMHKNRTQKGFGLIEMVVGIAVLSVSLVGIGAVAQRSLSFANRSLKETQADFLLEEGAEVMRFFRDNSWENIGRLSTTTTYYLTYGSTWATTTTPVMVDSTFTRTVAVSDVRRDSNDDIVSSGGTYDSGTKKITVTVAWPNGVSTSTGTLEFYLADLYTF